MASCGQAIPGLLKQYGIDVVFGIPGTHSIELYRGMPDSGVRHILPRHEQGAAFMADGYAQVAGKPAACFLITGPGLTNAATAMASAYLASIPMLVITPVNERKALGKSLGLLHETTDQSAIVRPFTAFSETAMEPDDVPELIARAFAVFCSARPRPVHIQIPIDVLPLPASGNWAVRPLPSPPKANAIQIAAAAELLRGAERPLIMIGGGTRKAGSEIVALAEKIAAPVAATSAAKGVVSGSHPLCLGSTIACDGTNQLIGEADVVLAVGTEMSETDTWPQKTMFNGSLIRLDIDADEMTSDYSAEITIHADAAQGVTELTDALSDMSARQVPTNLIDTAHSENRDNLTDEQHKHMDILNVLRQALPANTIIVGDMTQIIYTASNQLEMEDSGQYLTPSGYGTLGYALPAALGAKVAAPDQPVVAIAGDSGSLYTLQEMAVATADDIPLIFIVWNNKVLAQIRDDMVEAQIRPVAIDPPPPDFQGLAAAFGWACTMVYATDGLADAVAGALARPGPTLIEVRDKQVFEQ